MKRCICLLAALLLALSSCAPVSTGDGRVPEYLTPHHSSSDQFGVTQSIIEYGESGYMAIHYPQSGISSIDRAIESAVDDVLDSVNHEAAKLRGCPEAYVDYDSFIVNESTASVALTGHAVMPDGSERDILRTFVFDLATGRQLGLDDLFADGYLEPLSRAAIEEAQQLPGVNGLISFDATLSPRPSSFQNVILTSSTVKLYYERGVIAPAALGPVVLTIPADAVYPYLKVFPMGGEATTDGERALLPTPHADLAYLYDPEKPMVALTFDDGPHAEVTTSILDTLKKHGAHATFFVSGTRVASNADVVRRMVAEEHEIGNHTWGHVRLAGLSGEKITQQLNDANAAVADITGGYVPYFVRPPYGSVNKTVRAAAQDIGMAMVTWQVDPRDWESRNAQRICDSVMKNVKDGAVVLLHDMYPSTAKAVELLVPRLIEEGYQLVTVSELMVYADPFPAPGTLIKGLAG